MTLVKIAKSFFSYHLVRRTNVFLEFQLLLAYIRGNNIYYNF